MHRVDLEVALMIRESIENGAQAFAKIRRANGHRREPSLAARGEKTLTVRARGGEVGANGVCAVRSGVGANKIASVGRCTQGGD